MAYDNFGTSYKTALDRPYSGGFYRAVNTQVTETAPLSDSGLGVDIRDLGISAPPMQDQLQGLKSKIFQGASKVELGFMGKGKGSMQGGNVTPEMYGLWERQDIRELAELNKIKLSVHATPNSGSLAGLGEGGFSEQARENALHEIERAVDFAADTTKGGAVVVHLGEFPRPIQPYYGKTPEQRAKGESSFTAFEEEEKKAQFYLVDDRTGQIINQTRRNLPIMLPVYKMDKNGDYELDGDGNKVAIMDENKPGVFKMQLRDWSYFEKEAKFLGKKMGKDITAEEAQFIELQSAQLAQMRGWARLQGSSLPHMQERLDKVNESIKYYEQLYKDLPESEHYKLKQLGGGSGFTPPEVMEPLEQLKKERVQTELQIQGYREQAKSYEQQSAEIEQRIIHTTAIKDYAVQKSSETIARAAIFAMQKSDQMKTWQQNNGKPTDPLYIAAENVFPEQYGGHPQELKEMIFAARKEMEKRLKRDLNIDAEKAHELAETHIKATFDTGHANTWRKYFENDPHKTPVQNDTAFKKWYMDQIEDLAKSKVIGHIHVSDNLGWEDEHMTPGQGNAPIKEFIKRMKEAGVKDIIVEPAHQDFRAMLAGWREVGSSIYGLQAGPTERWRFGEVEFSYFGKTAPPYFLYGESAPDPEQWVLWSQTRME